MPFLLDTNPCVVYLNGRSDSIRRRLDALAPGSIVTCAVVRAELLFGAAKSDDPERTSAAQREFLDRFVSLPFDDKAAAVYATVRADLERRGQMIGSNDLLIAAIALAHDLTLVTHNVVEFGRVSGLRVEDWQSD